MNPQYPGQYGQGPPGGYGAPVSTGYGPPSSGSAGPNMYNGQPMPGMPKMAWNFYNSSTFLYPYISVEVYFRDIK